MRNIWSGLARVFHGTSHFGDDARRKGEYTIILLHAHMLIEKTQTSTMTVAITYWILVLLLGIVAFAYPKFRTIAHDRFERTHRFLGWTATALVWVQVVSYLQQICVRMVTFGSSTFYGWILFFIDLPVHGRRLGVHRA